MAAGLLADATILMAGVVAAAAVVAAVGGWVAMRLRAPERTLRAVRRAFERGDNEIALALLGRVRLAGKASVKSWHAERKILETECLYAAADAALRDLRFADALDHYKSVAALVGMDQTEAARRVVEAMLAEVRRLSASAPDGPSLPVLLGLILEREPKCAEALFWFGLFHLRHKDRASGVRALESAHAASEGHHVDPVLYLGAIWLRDGKPRDALRVLSEANRLAPGCPLVAYLLGAALMECGGDVLLALRALHKATCPEGLPRYVHAPNRLWADTLPAESWVRNLAQRAGMQNTQFKCPLGLDRVGAVLQSAQLALAEAMVTCGRAEEAVPIFRDLLKHQGDLPVRRGLGLALAKLGEWAEALPHLRFAHGAEKPPTPMTTGTLAVCLVHASGDRAANVRRALSLIASLNVRADAEWARRAGSVFTAAKSAGVEVSSSEVAELADVLASTNAADPTAAAVYDLLAGFDSPPSPGFAGEGQGVRAAVGPTESEDPHPQPLSRKAGRGENFKIIARLYVRAAQRHSINLPQDERLFDAAMADRAATRAFFSAREWDFDAAERLYLERWAERHPGTFPTAPGPTYAAEAGAALLADARRLHAQTRPEGARDVARLVLKLNPAAGPAYDLLAELAHRRGDKTEAADPLRSWHQMCPADPVPLARLAVLTAADNRPSEALATVREALERVRGLARVQYLLLAARLALAAGKPADATAFFDECLVLSDHPQALAGRAALAWANSDFQRLVGLADRMAAVPAEDPWFHYLAGAAALLAGHLDEAELSAKHAAGDPATAAEGRHLLALVRDRRNDAAGAADLLRDSTVGMSAVADHSVALRGQAAWRGGNYAEALRCWQGLPDARLKTWNLTTLMGGTAFLAGVQALRNGDPEDAANWLRQAARHGHADPRLESLLTTACAQAGAAGHGVELLEQAVDAGGPRPELIRHLARAYRHAGRLADARRVLDGVPAADRSLTLERGLLAIAEGHFVAAERAFAALLRDDPESAAAAVNLVFTRLSLGRLTEAIALMSRAASLAPTDDLRVMLTRLQRLAGSASEPSSSWSIDDDRAVIECLRSLGRLDSAASLFDGLQRMRSQSQAVRQAEAELTPLRAMDRIDRGDPAGARELLDKHSVQHASPLVRNLLGICCVLYQDFGRGVRHFQAALPPVGDDARMQQNLALGRGWMGDFDRSGAHWRRFLELQVAQMPKPPGLADYHRRIADLVRERLKKMANDEIPNDERMVNAK